MHSLGTNGSPDTTITITVPMLVSSEAPMKHPETRMTIMEGKGRGGKNTHTHTGKKENGNSSMGPDDGSLIRAIVT